MKRKTLVYPLYLKYCFLYITLTLIPEKGELLVRVRGIRTDYDIPGRDAEGAWIGTPVSGRGPLGFWMKMMNNNNDV